MMTTINSGSSRLAPGRHPSKYVDKSPPKLVHWPLIGGLLHLVQRLGDWTGPQPSQAPPLCTKCNSPPINGQCTNNRIAVGYNGAWLCGYNVPIKGSFNTVFQK